MTMTTNLKTAIIFGAGLALGMAIGNAVLAKARSTLS
jgi:hypothetical protein